MLLLEVLTLDNNQLTGSLPDTLPWSPNLRVLTLSNNTGINGALKCLQTGNPFRAPVCPCDLCF